jgi:hypothetical protein
VRNCRSGTGSRAASPRTPCGYGALGARFRQLSSPRCDARGYLVWTAKRPGKNRQRRKRRQNEKWGLSVNRKDVNGNIVRHSWKIWFASEIIPQFPAALVAGWLGFHDVLPIRGRTTFQSSSYHLFSQRSRDRQRYEWLQGLPLSLTPGRPSLVIAPLRP